ncbi:unnamed protein product, partial [Onchocerca flexuosa]|uniref:F5/8 type C domain-containing protein n=1 Tax=Onchocerca flexuosa TaxID=387005 RepID=A0A183I6K5_9BILA
KTTCYHHHECYDLREPHSWCALNDGQSWLERGCHCNIKEGSCIIERMNQGQLEYTYCTPDLDFECES